MGCNGKGEDRKEGKGRGTRMEGKGERKGGGWDV